MINFNPKKMHYVELSVTVGIQYFRREKLLFEREFEEDLWLCSLVLTATLLKQEALFV